MHAFFNWDASKIQFLIRIWWRVIWEGTNVNLINWSSKENMTISFEENFSRKGCRLLLVKIKIEKTCWKLNKKFGIALFYILAKKNSFQFLKWSIPLTHMHTHAQIQSTCKEILVVMFWCSQLLFLLGGFCCRSM